MRRPIHSLLLPLLVTASEELNEFKQYRDANRLFVWESTSGFIPIQSKSYGNMTIGNEMTVEFDFIYNGAVNENTEENFFRIGASAVIHGNGCAGKNHAYPAFYIKPNGHILFRLSDSNHCARQHEDFFVFDTSIPYHFRTEWNETNLFISINDGTTEFIYSQTLPGPRSQDIGDVVPVWWMSDKTSSTYWPVGNGRFWNITITSKVYTLSHCTRSL